MQSLKLHKQIKIFMLQNEINIFDVSSLFHWFFSVGMLSYMNFNDIEL